MRCLDTKPGSRGRGAEIRRAIVREDVTALTGLLHGRASGAAARQVMAIERLQPRGSLANVAHLLGRQIHHIAGHGACPGSYNASIRRRVADFAVRQVKVATVMIGQQGIIKAARGLAWL